MDEQHASCMRALETSEEWKNAPPPIWNRVNLMLTRMVQWRANKQGPPRQAPTRQDIMIAMWTYRAAKKTIADVPKPLTKKSEDAGVDIFSHDGHRTWNQDYPLAYVLKFACHAKKFRRPRSTGLNGSYRSWRPSRPGKLPGYQRLHSCSRSWRISLARALRFRGLRNTVMFQCSWREVSSTSPLSKTRRS